LAERQEMAALRAFKLDPVDSALLPDFLFALIARLADRDSWMRFPVDSADHARRDAPICIPVPVKDNALLNQVQSQGYGAYLIDVDSLRQDGDEFRGRTSSRSVDLY
jgi:hypothetical protein